MPVIWGDGVTKELRGTLGQPATLGGAWYWYWTEGDSEFSCDPDSDTCDPPGDATRTYLQDDPGNEWQADNVTATTPVNVDWVDWGDNLEAKSWPVGGGRIRVETVLYQDLGVDPLFPAMNGFTMYHLAGSGRTEMWGTPEPGTSVAAEQATVYSGYARLTVQKLNVQREAVGAGDLSWNAASGAWEGPAAGQVEFSDSVSTADDGPGFYNAEINVSGKLIYGYTLDSGSLEPGDYRITFSFEEAPELNTFFDAETAIVVSEEETTEEGEETGEEEEGPPEGAGPRSAFTPSQADSESDGGVSAIDVENNLTYIDIRLTGGMGGGN